MTDFRKNLIDRMIRIYGFEHPLVIQFAISCECYTDCDLAPMWDDCLKSVVECHEKNPYRGEDE